MKILITGGLGFVGINLVRRLAQSADCEVIAADVRALNPAQQAFLGPVSQRARCVVLDARDRAAFRALVEDAQVTHIVHAAAITPDLEQETAQAPFVVDVNLGSAINALSIGYESERVERVLVCSSSGVYGAPEPGLQGTQLESGPLDLDNLYAITKYAAEMLAGRFAELGPTRMASVRLGSVYGPMETPSSSRQHVSQVQRLTNALRDDQLLRLAGPAIRRDWVYSVDVADAVLALLQAPRWNSPVYNIGSGQALPFEQVAAPFIARGLRVEWIDDPRLADIGMNDASARTALDLTRLTHDSGFVPGYSLEAGLADYLDRRQQD